MVNNNPAAQPMIVEADEVGEWTQYLVNNGATRVTAERQEDGRWLLTPA
jgi:hypothetical protein